MRVRPEQIVALEASLGPPVQSCEESAPFGKVAHTRPGEADRLIRRRLRQCARAGIATGRKIDGSANVVGEPQWSLAGIAHYGVEVWKARKIDRLSGFVDHNGRVWVHKDRGNPATMIHEGVHKYANAALVKESQPLNEGVTEYFTRLAAGKQLARGRLRNYPDNHGTATRLANLVGYRVVCDAYFGGNVLGLKAAVDAKRGRGTWDRLITATRVGNWTEASRLLAR